MRSLGGCRWFGSGWVRRPVRVGPCSCDRFPRVGFGCSLGDGGNGGTRPGAHCFRWWVIGELGGRVSGDGGDSERSVSADFEGGFIGDGADMGVDFAFDEA